MGYKTTGEMVAKDTLTWPTPIVKPNGSISCQKKANKLQKTIM